MGFFEIAWAGIPCASHRLDLYADDWPQAASGTKRIAGTAWRLPTRIPRGNAGDSCLSAGGTKYRSRRLATPAGLVPDRSRSTRFDHCTGESRYRPGSERPTCVYRYCRDHRGPEKNSRGWSQPPNRQIKSAQEQRRRRLCEVVVSRSSPLVGQTVREAQFRSHYNAAIVAIHRNGARLATKIGDVKLEVR